MSHAAYSKLYNEAKRERHNILEAYKLANPEKYSELMKRVKEPEPLSKTQTLRPISQDNTNRLKEIIARVANGRKDWFIYVEIMKNGWIETHTLFEMLYKPEEALDKVLAQHPEWTDAKVVRVEKCQCPVCVGD